MTVAVLKGRQNYLCRRQLQGFQPFLLRRRPRRRAPGRRCRAGSTRPRPATAPSSSSSRPRRSGPSSPSAATAAPAAAARSSRTCFAEAARDRAGEADLVIANHALYFAAPRRRAAACCPSTTPSSSTRRTGSRSRPRPGSAAASRAPALRRLALDVERACRDGAEAAARAAARPGRARGRAAAARGRAGRRPQAAARGARRAGARADRRARRPRDRAARAGRGSRRARAPRARHRGAGRGLPRARRARAGRLGRARRARLGARRRLRRAARAALGGRPDGGPRLGDADDRRGRTLRSAAARARPRARGGRRLARTTSPSRRSSTCRGRCPTRAATASSTAPPRRSSSLLALSEGRALVLTSSYRALDAYRERVRGRVPYDVLVQGEAPRERLLERFRAEVGSVLLATSTFWQGVDVPGESLSLLVIDKLPFSAPGDPLHEARCEAVERRGGDWFTDYALPTAMLQLRQGFGRLIRGHSDRGVVAILDPRLRTRGYGRAFIARAAALPGRRGSRGGRGVFRRRDRCFRLNGRPAMAKKKPSTPPPPRRVQAPKTRTGSSARRARRAGSTWATWRAPAGDPLRGRGLRHRRADRGDPDRRPRRRRISERRPRQDARRGRLQYKHYPAQPRTPHYTTLNPSPPPSWNSYPADERPALLPVGALGRLHRAGAADQGSAQPRARRR